MAFSTLGISAYYHDSAAALLLDGEVAAAAQEERFTRVRHDAAFPRQAITYCLDALDLTVSDIDQIVFYEKPLRKLDRLIQTYLGFAPRGLASFARAIPEWLGGRMWLGAELKRELAALGGRESRAPLPLLFTEHHQAHAASAFYPSPFQRAAVLCMDGVGEWATTSLWLGEDDTLRPCWQIDFPHSLGLLYAAFTQYTGFKVNSGEYKLMGLAPYGRPIYVRQIYDHLLDVADDGSFRLNMEYFDYASGLTMTSTRFHHLFGGPPRKPESELGQREMDLARSIQVVTEELVLRLARTAHRELGTEYLCLAGGVALNCVANGRLLREGPFRDLWIQPAAGDAGGALGAAYAAWHGYARQPRVPRAGDAMNGSYLGPQFPAAEVRRRLGAVGAVYDEADDAALLPRVAALIAAGNVVGWYSGRMEFGPRALGGRSILGDPRSPRMQSLMNLKIKHRESFRPFAPAVLAEYAGEYFDIDRPSPYMLLVAPVQPALRLATSAEDEARLGIAQLEVARSRLPAVTHVDYSARIQTVHEHTNRRFHALLREFHRQTGCAVLINTSFNVRGEPIVCTPEDAYRCFLRTDMDYLVMENCLLSRAEQPAGAPDDSWTTEFPLD